MWGMRGFIVVGHRAKTSDDFTLNDLPGSGGRMDILCRCVNSAFFLSHDLRRDVVLYLVLLGEPDPPKLIRFEGDRLRYLNPDERSAGSLINKALAIPAGDRWRESTPGVWIRRGGLESLIEEVGGGLMLLDDEGEDIRGLGLDEDWCWVLSDHLDLTPEEMDLLSGASRVSVGPKVLHVDHCIILVNNELDRCYDG